MATHITHQDRTKTWKVDSDNDTWIVARDAHFKVENAYGVNDEYHAGTTVKVLGDMTVKGGGYSGVMIESDDAKVVIGEGSRIDARKANSGVHANGDNVTIINNGHIEAGSFGLTANNGGLIVNNGVLEGRSGIITFIQGPDLTTVRNQGLIDVEERGIVAAGSPGDLSTITNARRGEIHADIEGVMFGNGGNGRLTNRGLIESEGHAVRDYDGDMVLINRGKIIGTVDAGAGQDTLDLRGGKFAGTAHGGDGNDVYKVSSQDTDIVEDTLSGVDTVHSTVSYTLKENFEYLQLLGKKNTVGTGNAVSNEITGNAGNNTLLGLGGADKLSGGAGDDVLEGGSSADTFIFSTGFGNDVVEDFQNGTDTIDLSDLAGIDSYADLVLGHLSVDGSDLIITSGEDTLRLKDVALADLDATDFLL